MRMKNQIKEEMMIYKLNCYFKKLVALYAFLRKFSFLCIFVVHMTFDTSSHYDSKC